MGALVGATFASGRTGDDIEALIALFARTFVMEEALLRQSVTFLFMLADSRCDGE